MLMRGASLVSKAGAGRPALSPAPSPPPAGPFEPPYDLPNSGEALAIATVNTFASIAHPDLSAGNWSRWGFEQFGSGCSMGDEEYSIVCTGGHAHVEYTGEARFSYRTATWVRNDPANGGVLVGPRIADGHTGYPHWDEVDTSSDPYWEILGTNGLGGNYWTPLPPHPYGNLAYMPPEFGGGPKGSALYVCRGALAEGGVEYSSAVHKFDRDTLRWERIGTNRGSRCPDLGGAGNEGQALLDVARSRIWYIPLAQHSYRSLEYFDLTDLTFKTTAEHPGFAPGGVSAASSGRSVWLRDGKIITATTQGLYGIDPDTIATTNWTTLTVTGGAVPTPARNAWVYYPRRGAYYWLPTSGGSTMQKLTPPAGDPLAGTWTISSVALNQAVPAKAHLDETGAHRMLHYVPLIDRLAWIATDNAVWLMDPN